MMNLSADDRLALLRDHHLRLVLLRVIGLDMLRAWALLRLILLRHI